MVFFREIRPRSNTTCFEIMHKFLLLSLLFFIPHFHLSAQDIKRSSADTSVINLQMKKALAFAQNPATIDSANYYLDRFYASSKKKNYDKGIIEYFRIKAVTFFMQQKEDSFSIAAQHALDEAKHFHNAKEMALVADLKGWAYQTKEAYDSATTYFMKALRIADSLRDHKFSGEISINLSILFWTVADFNKAAEYASNAYLQGLKLRDTMLMSNGLFNLGNAKGQLKEYDTARILYRDVTKLVNDPSKYNYVLFRAISNDAAMLSEENKIDESIKKYKEILQLSSKIPSSLMSYIYSGLGAAQLKKNLLTDAETNLEHAIEIAQNANDSYSLRDNYLLMAQIKKARSDFKSALFFREKYESLNGKIMNETTTKNMHAMEKKYNSAIKDNQIARQQLSLIENKSTIEKKNNLNIALIAGIFFLLFVGLLIYRNLRNRHKILKQSEQLKMQKIIELEKEKQLIAAQSLLKGQEEERTRMARDLHDGVGGLLSGVKLSMSNMKGNFFLSEENALAMNNVIMQLDQSIAELRRVSHNMMPESLIKYGLKEALENYCETLNVSGKIKVQLQTYGMEERMEQSTEIVIYRMVQELLNNVIKHADAKNVLIQLMRKNDRFTLTVEDDGNGFDPKEISNGAGLENIKARAEYLNGNVDIVSSKGEGTSVTIEGNCA
jgi:signal transduction histidine kinase